MGCPATCSGTLGLVLRQLLASCLSHVCGPQRAHWSCYTFGVPTFSREQAIQMFLLPDSQDQDGFLSHVSFIPFIFSKSVREIKCYGMIPDYLSISFINSACGDLCHTSFSTIHYIDTLIKSEVRRIKC